VTHGANVHAENDWKRTPLAASLACCFNSNIPQVAEISDILLNAGTKITPDMIEKAKRIGKILNFIEKTLMNNIFWKQKQGSTNYINYSV
jgi:ankyrin repeat protein